MKMLGVHKPLVALATAAMLCALLGSSHGCGGGPWPPIDYKKQVAPPVQTSSRIHIEPGSGVSPSEYKLRVITVGGKLENGIVYPAYWGWYGGNEYKFAQLNYPLSGWDSVTIPYTDFDAVAEYVELVRVKDGVVVEAKELTPDNSITLATNDSALRMKYKIKVVKDGGESVLGARIIIADMQMYPFFSRAMPHPLLYAQYKRPPYIAGEIIPFTGIGQMTINANWRVYFSGDDGMYELDNEIPSSKTIFAIVPGETSYPVWLADGHNSTPIDGTAGFELKSDMMNEIILESRKIGLCDVRLYFEDFAGASLPTANAIEDKFGWSGSFYLDAMPLDQLLKGGMTHEDVINRYGEEGEVIVDSGSNRLWNEIKGLVDNMNIQRDFQGTASAAKELFEILPEEKTGRAEYDAVTSIFGIAETSVRYVNDHSLKEAKSSMPLPRELTLPAGTWVFRAIWSELNPGFGRNVYEFKAGGMFELTPGHADVHIRMIKEKQVY